MTALITVIIPFRNRARMLLQACHSLSLQSMQGWHALLINDSSGAEALGVAEKLCKADPRFSILHVPRGSRYPGPWFARNLGLSLATTKLVAFLDADDIWHPDKLLRQIPRHLVCPDLLSVCAYHRFNDSNMHLVETRIPPARATYSSLFLGNVIPLSTVVANRDRLLEVGGFYPEHHEDYGLWLRLFRLVPSTQYLSIDEPLVAYRLHQGQVSANRLMSTLAVYRIFCQHLRGAHRRLYAVSLWLLVRLASCMLLLIYSVCRGRAFLPAPFAGLASAYM